MNDNNDLRISRQDLRSLEDLVTLLERNCATAEQNLKARKQQLEWAQIIVGNVKMMNGLNTETKSL